MIVIVIGITIVGVDGADRPQRRRCRSASARSSTGRGSSAPARRTSCGATSCRTSWTSSWPTRCSSSPGAVLTETTLSFIGLGDPFQPSWGQLLDAAQVGRRARASARGGTSCRPGVCIVLVVLAFTLRRWRPRRPAQPASCEAGDDFPPIPGSRQPEITPPDVEPEEFTEDGEVIEEVEGQALAEAAIEACPTGPPAAASGRCPSRPTRTRRCSTCEDLPSTSALRRARSRPSTAVSFRLTTARRWASPASRAAARRRPPCRSCASCRRTPRSSQARSSSIGIDLVQKTDTAAGPLSLARDHASSSRAR